MFEGLVKVINAIRKDGWGNIYTGSGEENKDKRTGSYIITSPLSRVDIDVII